MIDERTSTAHHEAAHVVADLRLRPDMCCGGASIIPRDDGTLGRALHEDPFDWSESDANNVALSLYAGYAAQIELGEDEARARRGACSDFELADECRERVGGTEAEWIAKARAFVREQWTAITLIAAELLEHGSLAGEELEILLDVADGETTAEDLARFRAAFPVQGHRPR